MQWLSGLWGVSKPFLGQKWVGQKKKKKKRLDSRTNHPTRTPESSVGSLIRKSSNLTIFLWTDFPDISQKSSGYGIRHRIFLNYIQTLHQA